MSIRGFFVFAAAVCVVAPASVAVTGPAQAAGGVRLSCTAEGARDFSMSARYDVRAPRRKFNASFESAPGLGFAAGQKLGVAVGGVAVGQMALRRDVASGDIVGDLTFATELRNFPANFPNVTPGMSVTVGSLGCALR